MTCKGRATSTGSNQGEEVHRGVRTFCGSVCPVASGKSHHMSALTSSLQQMAQNDSGSGRPRRTPRHRPGGGATGQKEGIFGYRSGRMKDATIPVISATANCALFKRKQRSAGHCVAFGDDESDGARLKDTGPALSGGAEALPVSSTEGVPYLVRSYREVPKHVARSQAAYQRAHKILGVIFLDDFLRENFHQISL